jgi:nitrite reductase/ring-hydroxylating ferredoxin subunit
MLIYPAYATAVAHVALGGLQSRENLITAAIVGAAAFTVAGLHIAAALKGRRDDDPAASAEGDWHEVCRVEDIREGFARIARLPGNQRVAVFRQDGKLSAIANACAHQNGPLGEGRIVDGYVTCPWHGFQYRAVDGCSPAPFTEKVPTYRLRVADGVVSVHGRANPPGTYVEPVAVGEARR